MDATKQVETVLLEGLTADQQAAVSSDKRRLLVVAGAGSGKTEVMARRVAWWVAVDEVPKDRIVAFTFTERAAEEMKFRVRRHISRITPDGEDTTLGGMYVGTIHGFCLQMLRELAPDDYHNYDVMDESARHALVQGAYDSILGLNKLQNAFGRGRYATIDRFLPAYDILNEYAELDVKLHSDEIPYVVGTERDWCKGAVLNTDVGSQPEAEAFELAAARYYAYLRCRRFLDFSTSQSELLRLLERDDAAFERVRERLTHVVVDEVQDINPVQDEIIRTIVGEGALTAVGDHRQAIYGFRGGRVDIMGAFYEEMKSDPDDAQVVDLAENFRSTPRIVDVSNRWARTIGAVRSMSSPDMLPGNKGRTDSDPSHVAAVAFDSRQAEAEWIAGKIKELVRPDGTGAHHDTRDGERGLSYTDVAVLIRSSTDARTYMTALEREGIPAVFRAGPDLLSQPEVLLMVAALARTAGIEKFYGADFDRRSLPNRIKDTLGCDPEPEPVVHAACGVLRAAGLPLAKDVEERLLLAAELMNNRITGGSAASKADVRKLRTPSLRAWLRQGGTVRRVFPQTLYHFILAEAGAAEWDTGPGRGAAAMFHLGQLSSIITGIETPGWVPAGDFKYRMIAMYLWGAKNARVEEAPLLVEPQAVTIGTIHGAKGLEYAAVFLADVVSARFPSNFAKRQPNFPFDGSILDRLDPASLADNDNLDGERRLMYVALTRAERYLAVTSSKPSKFFNHIAQEIKAAGGVADTPPTEALTNLRHLASEHEKDDVRLVTSFSDLRYYLECPHDFYLRKVLGFAPTIDQAFGYGRGVHNLMRAIHSNPKEWAKLAENPHALQARLDELIRRGLFYLRYTTGEPLENMKKKASQIVGDYVKTYAAELDRVEFLPEREFETLIEEAQVLVSGAMDIVRLDDPPRVTLIDFKSGEAESDLHTKLDSWEMRLQVGLYGLAARHELEYEPERGLVRYLGESNPKKRELSADLDEKSLAEARAVIVGAANAIRERKFDLGPKRGPEDSKPHTRCPQCDFLEVCGRPEARRHRAKRGR
jgi:DNA helicase-2/ATP-dependent DNA helicase PcrA